VTDDKPLFFGTDGDTKVQFSSSATKTVISGADIRFSDTTKLGFGDADDVTINWDASKLAIAGGDVNYSGGDITISDSAMLTFGSSTVASSDQHIYHYSKAGSDCLVIAGLTARRVKTGCVFVSDGFLKIVV
jgi:hypothetical protein